VQVQVLPYGFECQGEVYKSLSAVAKAVTGQHCSGFHFFRMGQQETKFRGRKSSGDKVTRATPLAAQAEGGVVKLLRGHWNGAFLDEAEIFPLGKHDDQIDAASLALCYLAERGLNSGYLSPQQLMERAREAKRDPSKQLLPQRIDELCRRFGLKRSD
jgi:hypothetical protein